MDYIDRLTNLRINRDIKQKEVAEILGIQQSASANMKSGAQSCKLTI